MPGTKARFEMQLDPDLKEQAEKIAGEKEISLAELIRRYLKRLVAASDKPHLQNTERQV